MSRAGGAVTTVTVSRPGRRQYGLLDGLRAIAALMVVGYHAHPPYLLDGWVWDGALQLNIGVTVFFVLSGFLLYRPFVAARMAGAPGPGVRPYLLRRGLRVLPGYWVALTVFALVLPQFVGVFGPDWWVYYSLTQTWVPGRVFDGLAPAWSLSVEVSFYLALPVYALVLRRLIGRLPAARQARIEFTLLAVAVIATILARRFLFDRGEGMLGFLVWSVLGHVDWFAAGLALALASVLWEGAATRPRWMRFVEARPGTCWLGAAGIFAALGFLRGSPGDIVHVASLGVAVLLVAPAVFGDERHGAPRRLLGNRIVRWLGVISYGIFLWNEPIASWVAAQPAVAGNPWGPVVVFVVTTAAAIGLGALSYWLIERPAMALAGRRQRSSRGSNADTTHTEYHREVSRPVEWSWSAPRTAAPGGPRRRGRIDRVQESRSMTVISHYGRPVLRRWPIVLIVLLLSVAGTVAWSMTKAQTSWTATTALTTQSQNRAPEQDAVLSLGYVDYFNQATYQQLLRAEAGIPSSVSLKAETGAASPILYIEATATTPEAARSASQAAADTFRLDIRNGLIAERQREVDDLQKQVDAAVTELQKPGTTAAEGNVILDQVRSLQGRITDISSDATNHLKTLQQEPGLSSTVSSPVLSIAAGAFGGLVLGVLIALVLALLDDRVRGASDAANTGVPVLAEFPTGASAAHRERTVKRLLNSLRAGEGGGAPAAVTVIGVGGARGAHFATELAQAAATRRARAVLVHADLRGDIEPGPGYVDVLDDTASLRDALLHTSSGLQLLPTGDPAGRDPFRVVDPDRVAELVAELAREAGLTVFHASPLHLAPETQVLSAATAGVILVARRGVTRRSQLRAARDMLVAVDAPLVGIVLDVASPTEYPVVPADEPARRDTEREAADAAPVAVGPAVGSAGGPVVPAQADGRQHLAPGADEPTGRVMAVVNGARNGAPGADHPGAAWDEAGPDLAGSDEPRRGRRRPSPRPRPSTTILASNGQHPAGE